MPTCIVIDDERLARERLTGYIETLANWRVIGEAAEYHEAESLIRTLRPDACFVDINIIGGNGMELVKSLSSEFQCGWVFTTAYSEFAIHAFELDATDYLLKPFENSRLAAVLDKLETRTGRRASGKKEVLAVRSIGSVQFVCVNDIIWIKGSANYVELHCKDRMFLHRETMSNLASQLDKNKFMRVHRSAMVNIDKIASLSSELGRLSLLQLCNGDEVKISHRHRPELFSQLGLDQD